MRQGALLVASVVVVLSGLWLSTQAFGAGAVYATIASFQFTPRVMVAHPGDMVTWTNNDNYPHTVTSDPSTISAFGPNSDVEYPNGIRPGQSYTWIVPVNAPVGVTWYYYCRFHGAPGDGTSFGQGMTGAVTIQQQQ